MADGVTDWREGLEQVGTCPHCGVPVYVRPGDVNGTTLLPTPVYLCACRHLAVALSSIPVPPAPSAPPAPWQPSRPFYPCVPVSPATPSQPWQTPHYEDPTHPGLPPYTPPLNRPGGDY